MTFGEFQKQLEAGRYLGLGCTGCGTITFPPQGTCRSCHGRVFEVVELSGEATLRTFTVIRVPPQGRQAPYIVAMAELREGPWVMGNLVGIDPDEADMGLMGQPVRMGSQEAPGDAYAEASRVITFERI